MSNKSLIYLALLGQPVKKAMNRTYAASLGILKIILKNLPILSLISLIIFVDRAKSLRISKGNIDGNKQVFHRSIP